MMLKQLTGLVTKPINQRVNTAMAEALRNALSRKLVQDAYAPKARS